MSSYNAKPRTLSDLSNQDLDNTNGITRTESFLDRPAEPNQSAIERFMETYSVEHYNELAKKAKALLETALENARDSDEIEVRFLITCRAKTEESLREKLERRDKQRNYQTARAILEDVPDLAGVRVVLYTPNTAQRDRVEKAIAEIWKIADKIPHGDRASPRKANSSRIDNDNDNDNDNDHQDNIRNGVNNEEYVPKHLGYQANHFRVSMLPEQGGGPYKYKKLDRVEIQLVSALGHVWAEASHDIMYKSHRYGKPTKQEHVIVDALSGIITSGDLLLEQFFESASKRTYERWKHPEELTIWLRESDVMKYRENQNGKWTDKNLNDHFSAAGTDILYRFLSKTEKNYPIAVRRVLTQLKFPEEPISGLQEELKPFGSDFKPPKGLLAPFCIISSLMRERQAYSDVNANDESHKCSLMIDAFILLQTFSGTADAAKTYLIRNVKESLTEEQRESIDFILGHPLREDYLSGVTDSETHRAQCLEAGWDWFKQQACSESLCGFLFRLAAMGIVAEEIHPLRRRLEMLQIKPLSRENTLQDDDE